MLAPLSLMIGGYIFAQLLELATRKRDGRAMFNQILVVTFAVLGMIGAVLMTYFCLVDRNAPTLVRIG